MDYSEAVIYLAGCAVNGTIPDKSRLEGVDMAGLHAEASRHMLAAIVAYALESAGIKHELFTQSRAKALRKAVIQASDCREISARLEDAGIWHMPLKGSVMKEYYPAFGLREMSDVDILFDPSRAGDVRGIMKGLGFSVYDYNNHHHDSYHREPVSNVEMHRGLVETWLYPSVGEYFYDVRDKLIPDSGKKCMYHFSPEDFFLYMTAHTLMHYSGNGTGLRSLLDEYVYVKRFSASLDWEYISRENGKMGITDFEECLRTLAVSLFSGGEVSDSGRDMLERIIKSGAYGYSETGTIRYVTEVFGGSRLRYILAKIFPSFKQLKYMNPHVWRHKYLYPMFVLRRLVRAVTVSRKTVFEELKNLIRMGRKS